MNIYSKIDINLRTLENFLGRDWLSLKSDAAAMSQRRGREDGHPIRAMWSECRRITGPGAERPTDLSSHAAIAEFLDLTSILKWTYGLKGFDSQIRPRLLRPADYRATLYEARVAQHFARSGLDVRFADTPNGGGGADLRVHEGGRQVRVEAKLKDRTGTLIVLNPLEPFVRELADRSLRKYPVGINVTALVMGRLDEDTLKAAADAAEAAVERGTRGLTYLADPGMILNVSERPREPDGADIEQLVRSVYPRAGRFRLDLGPDGLPAAITGSTMLLGVLQGTTISSVLSNLKRASRQIGEGKSGIVCLAVDSGENTFEFAEKYARMFGYAVSQGAWGTGGKNRRIRAIVVSYGPFDNVSDEDNYKYRFWSHGFHWNFQPGIECNSEDPREGIRAILASQLAEAKPAENYPEE